MVVVNEPNTHDDDEADSDEDNVQTKQQAVDDRPNHLPFLRRFASLKVFVHLETDGHKVSAQLRQLLQSRLCGCYFRSTVHRQTVKLTH